MGDTTSESGSSEPRGPRPTSQAATARGAKKRKPTYYARKEEKKALREEVEVLQARIRELERAQLLREQLQPLTLRATLRESVFEHDLGLAGASSLVSQHLAERNSSPLESYIHLPKDPDVRRQILKDLNRPALNRATAFVHERIRFLDLRRQHRHFESFDLPHGEYLVVTCDVTPFVGLYSVQDVTEEFLYFVRTQEISISEALGRITINEVEDVVEAGGTQSRLISSLAPGVDIEMNMIGFAEYVDELSTTFGGPYAVTAIDYVNEDDIFPYDPLRVRRDISAAALILECPPPGDDSGISAKARTITLARWAFIRMRPPAVPLPSELDLAARETIRTWDSVMLQVLAERLERRPRRVTASHML